MTHLMLAASVLSLAGSVIAETWTVDDDGPADFDNIQAAVDAAEHDDEIIVSPGTYTGGGNYVVNMNGKSITLRSSGSYLDTIIDGEATRGCIQCTSGEDAQTSIENFTLTGGLANDGGGILCMSSSPTLKGCLITSNAALVSGGGIFVSNGNPSLDDCRIYFNECPTDGGGLYLYNSNATIISTEIFYNDARNGGGLSCFASDNIRMARCHLFGNTADETGGGARIQSSKISLSFCSAVSNSCMQDGGGIYVEGSSNLNFASCVISENTSEENGGGYYAAPWDDVEATMTDCTIKTNTAAEFGGGISSSSANKLWLVGTTVCGNVPDQVSGGITNISAFIYYSGNCPEGCPGDVDENGSVSLNDILVVLENWGPCP